MKLTFLILSLIFLSGVRCEEGDGVERVKCSTENTPECTTENQDDTVPVTGVENEELPQSPSPPQDIEISASTIAPSKEEGITETIREPLEVVGPGNATLLNLIQNEANATVAELMEKANETFAKEIKLSQRLRSIIDHYRAFGEVTVPGMNLPNHMKIPDTSKSAQGYMWKFTNVTAEGMSNYTIEHINIGLDKKEVYVEILTKRLVLLGNYDLKNLLFKRSGEFNVTLFNVITSGSTELKQHENGTLYVSDIDLDMYFRSALTDFKLGSKSVWDSVIETLLGAAAPIIFEAIKPAIINDMKSKVKIALNEKLEAGGSNISLNSAGNPVDKGLEEARQYVREQGYDPMKIDHLEVQQGIVSVNITNFQLDGLSDFDRVGDVNVSMTKGVVQIGAHIASKEISGKCTFKIRMDKFLNKEVTSKFSLERIHFRAVLNQSLDIKQSPKLHELDLYVGKPKLEFEKPDHLQYLLMRSVNSISPIVRHIVVDAIELPLKQKIQDLLHLITLEKIIEQRLTTLQAEGV